LYFLGDDNISKLSPGLATSSYSLLLHFLAMMNMSNLSLGLATSSVNSDKDEITWRGKLAKLAATPEPYRHQRVRPVIIDPGLYSLKNHMCFGSLKKEYACLLPKSSSQKDKRTGRPKIWIYRDKVTNEPKGDATVTYQDPYAAQAAVEWFNNKEFHGTIIEESSTGHNNGAQPAYSNAASADSLRSCKTGPNPCYGRQYSNISFANLTGKSTAGDYQDCGAS
ncbi:transcription initiation factor TFIID subunit 15, partial [Tanacetum coccineum]